jgi:hypothetical protein
MGEPIVRTLLLSAVGAVALAGLASSANAQAPCWHTVYGYYSCATPPATYYQPPPPPSGPTPYAAWNAYDYRDYRQQPMWLPTYPGPKPSSSTFGAR